MYVKRLKALDLSQDEAAEMRRSIEHAQRMIAAVLPVLQEVDRRLRAAHVYVSDVESKLFWAPDVEVGEKIEN